MPEDTPTVEPAPEPMPQREVTINAKLMVVNHTRIDFIPGSTQGYRIDRPGAYVSAAFLKPNTPKKTAFSYVWLVAEAPTEDGKHTIHLIDIPAKPNSEVGDYVRIQTVSFSSQALVGTPTDDETRVIHKPLSMDFWEWAGNSDIPCTIDEIFSIDHFTTEQPVAVVEMGISAKTGEYAYMPGELLQRFAEVFATAKQKEKQAVRSSAPTKVKDPVVASIDAALESLEIRPLTREPSDDLVVKLRETP